MIRQPPRFHRLHSMLGRAVGSLRAVRLLESGTNGKSYRIDTDEARYFAKLFSPASDALLGPREQFDLLNKIKSLGITPVPVACDESAGLLVTEFIDDAEVIDEQEFRRPERLREIAAMLKRLHGAPVDIEGFEPSRYARRYIEGVGGRARLAPPERKRADELLELAANLDFESTCLCHNDLVAENFLFGSSLKLVDFDFAVAASPILDLASVVVMNSLTPAEEAELVNAYLEQVDVPFSLPDFARVQRLVRLLAHFWSLASRSAETAIVARYRMEDV